VGSGDVLKWVKIEGYWFSFEMLHCRAILEITTSGGVSRKGLANNAYYSS